MGIIIDHLNDDINRSVSLLSVADVALVVPKNVRMMFAIIGDMLQQKLHLLLILGQDS